MTSHKRNIHRLDPICEDASVSPDSKRKSPTLTPNSPVLTFKFFPKSTSLFRVKCTTSRLGLDSRRPSIEAWKRNFKGKKLNSIAPCSEDDSVFEELTDDRINKINKSIGWIKEELMQMKKQDQDLASQFLRIRKTIYNLKLEWSCMDHRCMLEDAETDMDTIEELRRVTDLPVPAELDLSLIEKGFTKFNMATRRYSLA